MNELKTENMNLRLSLAEKQQIKQLANSLNLSNSNIVRLMLQFVNSRYTYRLDFFEYFKEQNAKAS